MELLVLIPLIGFILFWQRRQPSSLSAAALHTVAALILLLFIAGLAGWLPEMRMLLLGLGTAVLVVELLQHRKHHLPTLSSVPLLMLLIMCLLFFLVHRSSDFRYYDEFAHWGIFLKDMLANGGFWTAETNSMHPRYPPGPTLWQYLFVFTEVPREGAAYFAQFLLLIVPLLVLFESLHWKQAGWIAGIVVLLLFGFGNYGHGIASLYADHVLAAWIAGLFLNFMAEPRARSPAALALYVLPLSALAMIKNAGLIFALALAVLFFLLLVLRQRQRSLTADKKLLAMLLLAGVAWIAGPLMTTAAWSQNRNASGAAQETLSAPGLVAKLTGKGAPVDPQRAQAIREMFTDVFLNQQLSKNEVSDKFNEFSYEAMSLYQDKFKLTTATFLVLFVAWSAFMVWIIVPGSLRPDWAAGLAGMLGIALAYMVMLYLTYLFHRNGMVSYVRYVHSVTLALLLAGLAPLLPVFAQSVEHPRRPAGQPSRITAPAVFTFALLALLLVEKPHLQSLARPMASPLSAFRNDIRPLTDTVRASVGRARLWVYLPDTNPHNLTSRVLLYELAPTPATINRDFEYFDRPRAEILADWADYDYVWVVLEYEELDEKLRAVVGPDLGTRLYRVEHDQGAIRLELMEPGERPPG